ncbi:hypothetical protein B0H19DRAFT_1259641 [Mycena capillaripes]|nr:hypothetical protein B0H19DRAFT_1259641 [Mycena capillaripes]
MPGQNHPEAPEAMFERFEIMEEHGAAFLPETKNDGTTAEEVNFVPASAEIVLGSTDDGSAVEDEYAPPSNLPPMTTPKSEYTNAQWWPSAPDTPSSYFPSSPFHSQGTTPELSPQTLELPVLHPQVASMAAVHASNLRRTKHARFFYCDLCGAELTTRHNLKNHKNAHAGLRPHVFLRRHQKKCKRFAGLA